jgi:hypothetical protein
VIRELACLFASFRFASASEARKFQSAAYQRTLPKLTILRSSRSFRVVIFFRLSRCDRHPMTSELDSGVHCASLDHESALDMSESGRMFTNQDLPWSFRGHMCRLWVIRPQLPGKVLC